MSLENRIKKIEQKLSIDGGLLYFANLYGDDYRVDMPYGDRVEMSQSEFDVWREKLGENDVLYIIKEYVEN